MSDSIDKISYAAKLATDVLFVRNPVGTSMGALTGVILDGAISGAAPFLNVLAVIKQAGVSVFHWIAFGIVGFNIRTWMKHEEIDPKIAKMFLFIEDQVRQGRLTRAQAKLRYNEIIIKTVESVSFAPETAERLRRLSE